MSFFLDRRRLILAAGALVAAPRVLAQGRSQETFEIAASETATIDGRQWNTPIVGGTTVDAVHRAVLLRFPTAADEIADLLRSGRVLVQAELALGYGDGRAGHPRRPAIVARLPRPSKPTARLGRRATIWPGGSRFRDLPRRRG